MVGPKIRLYIDVDSVLSCFEHVKIAKMKYIGSEAINRNCGKLYVSNTKIITQCSKWVEAKVPGGFWSYPPLSILTYSVFSKSLKIHNKMTLIIEAITTETFITGRSSF